MVLEYIIAATIVVSLVSLVGIVLIFRKDYEGLILPLVSFSAGTLLGAAFLDLLPEALEATGTREALGMALAGLLVFFALEKLILWHHHHSGSHATEKPAGYLNLIGDGLHNFFDGMVIAAAFLTSTPLGIVTTIAVILHEIPQEIGDFSLLLYSGFTVKKALAYNLLSALAAVAGALAFYYASGAVSGLQAFGLSFTAGMFIYIALADLVPELHKEHGAGSAAQQLALITAGAAAIYFIATYLGV
jgi:zinc and cadmium transporter